MCVNMYLHVNEYACVAHFECAECVCECVFVHVDG